MGAVSIPGDLFQVTQASKDFVAAKYAAFLASVKKAGYGVLMPGS
jgi:hypothetical protein